MVELPTGHFIAITGGSAIIGIIVGIMLAKFLFKIPFTKVVTVQGGEGVKRSKKERLLERLERVRSDVETLFKDLYRLDTGRDVDEQTMLREAIELRGAPGKLFRASGYLYALIKEIKAGRYNPKTVEGIDHYLLEGSERAKRPYSSTILDIKKRLRDILDAYKE